MATDSSSTTVSLTDGPVVLRSGIAGEAFRIPTADPASFHQAISEPSAMPAAEILGSLFLPPGRGPWPVVIVVPGSLGVAPSHVAKADYLTDAGIACCVIDPFGTRGVTSTVSNQAQYSFAASAWDVLATAAVLVGREDIDAARIGAQGHSRGGSAVLSAACMAPLVGPQRTPALAAVYAAYPWSGMQFARPDVGGAVVRSVIGDLVHPLSGQADPRLTERDAMIYLVKSPYGRKGARIGTADDQARAFHADMMEFWTIAL